MMTRVKVKSIVLGGGGGGGGGGDCGLQESRLAGISTIHSMINFTMTTFLPFDLILDLDKPTLHR